MVRNGDLGSRIENFNMDISCAVHEIVYNLDNVLDDSHFDKTLDILDNCSNILFDIWNRTASDGIVFLNDLTTNIDDTSSVEQHFIKWCNDNSIKWDDLSGSSDNSIWGSINPPSGEVLLPSGDRVIPPDCSGQCESSLWINISKVTILQFKSIIYELMFLNRTTEFDRTESKENIDRDYTGFVHLPNFFYEKEPIKKMKRYIIMFYIMIKSKYVESDVNTGLLF
tara:strand:- start:265 stop:939 length:675 start_codon:yes stop_codon:yes gene_type:complete